MTLMVEIGDRAAQGRACGNLGNVHYLLGNFSRAIHFHQERLKIAREFGDRAAGMSWYNTRMYVLGRGKYFSFCALNPGGTVLTHLEGIT